QRCTGLRFARTHLDLSSHHYRTQRKELPSPGSVHVVENRVSSFREGARDVSDFWIKVGGKYVYIRYFAVLDKKGKYRGTLEVSQEISGIKAIE
ncbi:MAG: PAS domain-containing protein, partial [Bacillota bacterium]